MTSSSDDRIVVFLSCNHSQYVVQDLPMDELILCLRCRRMSTVTEAPNYVVKCTASRCPVGRSFGSLKASAEQFAVRHRRRYPNHIVEVRDKSEIVHRFGGALQEPLFEYAPPKKKSRVIYSLEKGFTDGRDDPPPF